MADDDAHDARRLTDIDRGLLIETLTHLRQLQALALERDDLDRAYVLGQVAKDYQVELDRRTATDELGGPPPSERRGRAAMTAPASHPSDLAFPGRSVPR
jgi:hypothetical protein